jgi:two-component system response regulator LytT
MNIVIIEDEIKTAKALGKLILSVKPEAKILASIQSVETAVRYLSDNESPDLIFMDVQLADGLCFEIFKSVKIVSPVIFCTAYDEYALDAIKSNGIDYVLKPFSPESITKALEKVHEMKSFFQKHQNSLPDLESLLGKIGGNSGKKGFLVFKSNKYITVQTEKIAFFYIKNEISTIMTYEQQEYQVSQSLDDLQFALSPKQFFRLNRQYLINYEAVKEVEHYFARKLYVRLTIPTPEKLLVGKAKAGAFLNWLENR